MVINFIAIVYNASIYLFATNYVVARGYAHSLLGRLDAIPGSPSFSFDVDCLYACLLLVFITVRSIQISYPFMIK